MERTVLIEGVVLLIISLVTMAEGVHLVLEKNPQIVYDVLGPGLYILFLGVALLATGIVHLIANYKRDLTIEKVAVKKTMKKLAISMLMVLGLYTLLINVTGYLVATIIFFVLEFRIMGIRSWLTNVMLTVILTAVYYIVFVHFCEMVFPRGWILG